MATRLFGKVINELVLGADSKLIAEQRAGATQTPGGTGALRLSADFIAQCLPGRGVWLSNPTWPIHETIFAAAEVKVSHYPYVGSDNRLDVDAMLAVLNEAPKGDVVLLHACCHNPTGFDLSHDDWQPGAGRGAPARVAAADRLCLPGLRRWPGAGRVVDPAVCRRAAGSR